MIFMKKTVFNLLNAKKPDMEMTVYIKRTLSTIITIIERYVLSMQRKRMMNMFLHITMQLKWRYAIKKEK